MSALQVTMTLGAVIRRDVDDQDAVAIAWQEHVHDAGERFKAEHPEWFVA
jgi:hypothetical protein